MTIPSEYQIVVHAEASYLAEQSKPSELRYVFAYRVNIKNLGTKTAQLISRHWYISDANGKVQEVIGEGVIGEQPILHPGEEFEYTSGAILNTPVGSMHGYFSMVGVDSVAFNAEIPAFTLAQPNMIH